MQSTVASDADIDALFTEIELLHKENKLLKLSLSKIETRITTLESSKEISKSSIEKLYKQKKEKLPGAISFPRNPEE